ncbi:estradiol 17-beta-dehydrogenase 8 isoform X1 [Hydra vulgaris]|uniref:estradiol 17-beta-dehydrogenase 8 isoform X1 n=1 Tax=Hydra vulgaris TaxID=6087 RepID=UPI001F5EF663|nr:estradiol 17-beta-dehydrogenase 8 [Hydra vulgaris]
MAGSLSGRLALITGAASGIGKAVCELFSKEGAIVIGVGLGDVSGVISSLKERFDEKHLSLVVNVSQNKQVEDLVKEICKKYSRPPCIVVNCAGITRDALMVKMSEEEFDDVIDVNLKGTFLVTKHVAAELIKSKVRNASIINIASIVGKIGNIGQTNYAASKAGVISLTKSAALELSRYNIRCNAVLPGFIETNMTQKIPQNVKEKVKAMIPLGYFGQADDIARTCLFLASEQSRYITAAAIEVSGGLGA